ncbi:MAG: fructose PTS transporter subunit IIA [Lactococcus lactis]|jgi:PTS system fructose-specific IIA component|nr:fructose PTS transporter subunit IIA [Lactococcus lactis]
MKFETNNILLDVNVDSKLSLFKYIASYTLSKNIIDDEQKLVDALLEREKEVSTGLQDSFAIPHAKADFIKKPTVIFLKLSQPIQWETFDGKPISNVFALLVPLKYEGTEHLKMISNIATLLLEEEFTELIKNTKNINDLEKSISKAMQGEN